jgi:two-component system chemotaxis response regulator CheY
LRDARFLIVDDSKILISAVKNVITNRFGATSIATANNGSEAWDILRNTHIDIIISDWHMPQMDGHELLKMVRSDVLLKECPFIMMSTHGDKEAVVQAIRNGVSHYVVKPFSPAKIEDAVRKAWNGANKRAAQRFFGLPKHRVSVYFNGQCIEAQILDMSRSGMLLSLKYHECIKLFNSIELSVEFDDIDKLAIININFLPATVLRIEVASSFHPSTMQCEIGLKFESSGFERDVKESLANLITFLSNKEKVIFNPI